MRCFSQFIGAVVAIGFVFALGCHKEPRAEIVKPPTRTGNNPTPSGRSDASTAGDRDGGMMLADGGNAGSGARDGGGDDQAKPAEGSSGTGSEGAAGDEPQPPIETPPFTKLGLLQAAASCALDHYRAFETRAVALAEAAQAAADGGGTSLGDARSAWLAANQSWQRAELFRVGPAAASTDPGGQNMRDQIYFFPYTNRCLINQGILDQTYTDTPALSATARGMSALEYLLFYDGPDNACSPSFTINTRGTWAALSSEELARRRAAYAAAVAADVVERVRALIAAWEPDHGNFEAKLTEPGKNGSPFPTDQDALNALSNAIFYVEQEVKDWKLGTPLGIAVECTNMATGGNCPEAVETLYARVSKENIRENLTGLREIFQGCGPGFSGLGFDDWLGAIGAEDLATRMLDAISAAESATDGLDVPLEDGVVSEPAKVRTVHAGVKMFTDLLKGEFVSLLNLDVPMSSLGDND